MDWEVALQPRHIMGGIAPPYRPSLTPAMRNRRTIYAFRYRGLSDPLLDVLDKPGADLSCPRRDETTVANQAFTLFNGRFVHARSLVIAARVARRTDSPLERIEAVFATIYGRPPRPDEIQAARRHIVDLTQLHSLQTPPRTEVPEVVVREMIAEETGAPFRWQERMFLEDYRPDPQAADVTPDVRALADLCLVLLNSSEFLYVY
jgi:Protein of unknown function (DUF1553)